MLQQERLARPVSTDKAIGAAEKGGHKMPGGRSSVSILLTLSYFRVPSPEAQNYYHR